MLQAQTIKPRWAVRREQKRAYRTQFIKAAVAQLQALEQETDVQDVRIKGTSQSLTTYQPIWVEWSTSTFLGKYSLYFTGTQSEPFMVGLWIGFEGTIDGWSPIQFYALEDFESGEELVETVFAFLASPEMDVILRWIESEPSCVAYAGEEPYALA